MRARGVALGEEFRGKGVRFVRAPVDRLIEVLISIPIRVYLGPAMDIVRPRLLLL